MCNDRTPAGNSTYTQVAVHWLNQALCYYQSLCLADSESLRNRHLRVAANRCQTLKKTIVIEFNNIEKLQKLGFVGFKNVAELNNNPNLLPNQMGVYLVLNLSDNKTEFLTKGVGGFFKGKDPNISIAELENNWVKNCKTIYIGKAGGLNGNATLRSRLKQYLKFGQGKNIGHYGGRLIWQLKNHLDLTFCWLPMTDIEPRELEKKLLAEFINQYGQRPFANLTG